MGVAQEPNTQEQLIKSTGCVSANGRKSFLSLLSPVTSNVSNLTRSLLRIAGLACSDPYRPGQNSAHASDRQTATMYILHPTRPLI